MYAAYSSETVGLIKKRMVLLKKLWPFDRFANKAASAVRFKREKRERKDRASERGIRKLKGSRGNSDRRGNRERFCSLGSSQSVALAMTI